MAGDKKEDFSSFQIGSMPGFGPGAGTAAPAPSAPADSSSAPTGTVADGLEAPSERRFPTLEVLLECDNDDIVQFAEAMGATCQELDELIAKRSGRIKQEAQKARDAYEQVFSLIDELLEVKSYLMSPVEESAE